MGFPEQALSYTKRTVVDIVKNSVPHIIFTCRRKIWRLEGGKKVKRENSSIINSSQIMYYCQIIKKNSLQWNLRAK